MHSASRSRHSTTLASGMNVLRDWAAPAVILAVLLSVVLIGGTVQVRQLLAAREASHVPTAEAPAQSGSAGDAATPAAELGGLVNSLLFGRYEPQAESVADAAASAAAAPTAELPETSPGELPEAALGVTLRGVVFATEPTARRAIIDGGTGTFEDYGIGDGLPGDVVIRYIEARRIVVERNGELLAVSLPDPAAGMAGANAALPGSFPPEMRIPIVMPGNLPPR